MLRRAFSLLGLALVPVFLAIRGRLPISLAVCGFAGVVFLADRSLNISAIQLPWLPLPLAAAAVLAWSLVAAEKQSDTMSLVEALFLQCVAAASLLYIVSPLLEHETITWSAMAAAGLHSPGCFDCGVRIPALLLAAGQFRRGGRQHIAMDAAIDCHRRICSPDAASAAMVDVAGAILIVIAIVLAFSNRDNGRGVFFEITQPEYQQSGVRISHSLEYTAGVAASMYIVVEGEDPGFDIFVNGRALARNEDALEKLAHRLGVRPILDFFSADENSMALLLEEGAGDPEWAKTLPPPQWFAAEDGLITVCTLIDFLREHPLALGNETQEVLKEMRNSSGCFARRRNTTFAGNWP